MQSFTLLISEKPQAAMRIAYALATNSVKKVNRYGAYWFEFEINGKKYVCIPSAGHLFLLDTENSSGWNYPVFDVKWVPTFTKKGSEFTKKYYKNIEALAKKADEFIVACDYDTEGEVIGYNILKFICNRDDAKRMKFSTLTKGDLIEAYENLMEHIDFGQVEAGLTRHHLDFIWGINTTRALTLALKNYLERGFQVVSTGRVQGPTLAILTNREIEIRNFKPVPYWQIELHALVDGKIIVALHEADKIWDKEKAKEIFDACKGKDAKVEDIERKEYELRQPPPFDTTSLQTEAYRVFGFSPIQTLAVAESLYTQGFISYPRTGSQKLPPKIGYKNILESLSKLKNFVKDVSLILKKKELKPREGMKTDPAHPAIFPTSQTPNFEKLSSQEKKLYELVVRRFLSTFSDPAKREAMKVVLDVNGHNFIATGHRTIDSGWIEIYEKFIKFKEQPLPDLQKGQILKVKDLKLLDKETQPPPRYSQASILKIMEKKGLGTKATRAQILQTLYDRGYIRGKSIEVTKFGEQVTKVLEEYSPKIIGEELTRKFEEEMELVNQREKEMETVIEEAKEVLTEILIEFKNNEMKIGEELSKAYLAHKKKQRTIGICPKCGRDLVIITSKKTKKRFVGCTGYKDGCDFSMPLPQKGLISTTSKTCETCGYPMIQLKFGRNKPFLTCINMNCPTKKNYNKTK